MTVASIPGAGEAFAAEDVPAADDDRDLHAEVDDFLDLLGEAQHHRGRDAVVELAHQGFARHFEEDALVRRLAWHSVLLVAVKTRPRRRGPNGSTHHR
jgi:hypothetical protein